MNQAIDAIKKCQKEVVQLKKMYEKVKGDEKADEYMVKVNSHEPLLQEGFLHIVYKHCCCASRPCGCM